MGQRHQLFVISKLACGRYRCLAATHHQWLYGQSAVHACQRLVRIFQEPKNHALLAYEKRLANQAPDELWNRKINWANDVPEFPFIATCLVLGTSLNAETGEGANFHSLQCNVAFDAGDNNDGVTVLDVTNPAQVRYAFAVPNGEGVETKNFRNTPLTAFEYAASYDEKWVAEDDEDYESGVPTKLVHFLQSQTSIDTTVISAPLIDEAALESAWPAAWRNRSDLKLPAIPALPAIAPARAASDDSSHGDTDSLQVLHEMFARSYRFMDPLYEEPVKSTQAAASAHEHIKQVVHLATLGKPWKHQVRGPPTDRHRLAKEGLSIWPFPVDDIPLTAGHTLDVIQSWIQWASLSRQHDFALQYFNTGQTKPQTLIKAFSLAGPEHLVVKPWPGKAFWKATMHFSSSATPIECALEAIEPGQWTVLVATDSTDEGMSHTSFKCGFVSRDDKGDLVVVNAAEFRQRLSSGAAYEAAVALDAGEEDYGKGFVGVLSSEEGTVRSLPVSVLERADVQEALDMIKRYEASVPPHVAEMRKQLMAIKRAKYKEALDRAGF